MSKHQQHLDAIHRLGRDEWPADEEPIRRERVTTQCPLCEWQVEQKSERLGWLSLSDHYRLRHPEAELPPAA